jgi:hypothetical protein
LFWYAPTHFKWITYQKYRITSQVWVLSAVISVPPLIGWNDWSSQSLMDRCELTTERAFVVFSALGSFFVPLLLMVVIYVKIFLNARKRIRTNRGMYLYVFEAIGNI